VHAYRLSAAEQNEVEAWFTAKFNMLPPYHNLYWLAGSVYTGEQPGELQLTGCKYPLQLVGPPALGGGPGLTHATPGPTLAGTRIWHWQSQEDKFPNATNPTVYSAFNKFDLASSTAPTNCLAASWAERFNVSDSSTEVWAWTGKTCSTQLPFMCKRKRELRAAEQASGRGVRVSCTGCAWYWLRWLKATSFWHDHLCTSPMRDAAYKSIPVPSTVKKSVSVPVSPGLPPSAQEVTYSGRCSLVLVAASHQIRNPSAHVMRGLWLISPYKLPSTSAAVNYDTLNFADAEAACQKQCAHLTSFSSLQDQVWAGVRAARHEEAARLAWAAVNQPAQHFACLDPAEH
jgi:hypothetical protein